MKGKDYNYHLKRCVRFCYEESSENESEELDDDTHTDTDDESNADI